MGLFRYIQLGVVREMRQGISENNQPGSADLQAVRSAFLIREAALNVTMNLDRVLRPRSGGEKEARDQYLHWRLARAAILAAASWAVRKRLDFKVRVAYPSG